MSNLTDKLDRYLKEAGSSTMIRMPTTYLAAITREIKALEYDRDRLREYIEKYNPPRVAP